jgi:hypothetical protein
MRDAPAPRLHLFVCANRREGSPLGPGCGDHGEHLYAALKQEVAARGATVSTWITKTHCLGICPKHGATVARYSTGAGGVGTSKSAVVTEATPADVDTLLAEPSAPLAHENDFGVERSERGRNQDLLRELDALEELQRKKVLDLARRLKPGLTLEDVQNPHDFPELDDPDWHYADGVLAGIASVRSALVALSREAKREE